MDHSESTALVAYGIAGLVMFGCAFAPRRSLDFRLWTAVLGGLLGGWPAWVLQTDRWFLPPAWRLAPLAVPTLVLVGTLVAVLRDARARQRPEVDAAPEAADEPVDPNLYPPDVPTGEVAPPHDPWKALYVSLALQRAKWNDADASGRPETPAKADAGPRRRTSDRAKPAPSATPVAPVAPTDSAEAAEGTAAATTAPGDAAGAGTTASSGASRRRRGPGYRGRHRGAPPAPPGSSGAIRQLASPATAPGGAAADFRLWQG